MNRILLAALGNSDPYTESHKDKLGPTLTLLNDKQYSHIILFLSPEMHQTNRLELFKKILHHIYHEVHHWAMPQIIEENFKGNDIYEAEECFLNIRKSIQRNKDILSIADEIICSKAAGTPQFKNTIEVISRIYYPDKAKILSVGFEGTKVPRNINSESIPTELISQENLEKNSERINSRNEATEILFLSKLQSLIELIKNYEYNAALTLLDSIYNEFEDKFSKTVLNKKKRNEIKRGLEIAKLFLSFEFQTYYENKESRKTLLLQSNPELASQLELDNVIHNNKALIPLYVAINNLLIFKEKKLNKEFVLNVAILLERLLKNSLQELIDLYKKTDLNEFIPIQFNPKKDEQELEYFPRFKEFIQGLHSRDFDEVKGKLIQLGIYDPKKKSEYNPVAKYLDRINNVSENYYPNVLDLKFCFLYIQESSHEFLLNTSFHKIASEIFEKYNREYDQIIKKRNDLAHNFKNISDEDFNLANTLFELIIKLYQEIWYDKDFNLHQRFSDYIIAIINRL